MRQQQLDAGVPAGPQFYVDPNGSDGAAGTLAAPWRTLDGARLNVRARGYNVTPYAPATITVAAGDYDPVTFDAGDSGSAWDVRWRGLPGARILAGTRVTAWQLVSGSIYRAPVVDRVTTLWENGVRAREARFPAYSADASYPRAQNTYLTSTGVTGSKTVIQYGVGQLSPAAWDLNSVKALIWPGGQSFGGGSRAWFQEAIRLSAVNAGARTLTMADQAIYDVFATLGSRYFLAGDLSFLVGAGQWYHDVTNGWLYYWARDGAIADQEILIPSADCAVSFIGDSAAVPCKNISIEGFEIGGGDSVETYRVTVAPSQKATVYGTDVLGISVRRCDVWGGLHGVYWRGAARRCRVEDTAIHGTAAYGGFMENHPSFSPDVGDVNRDNVWADVRISDSGEMFGGASTLYLLNSGHNLIEYFDLYNSPRAGLEMVGGAGLDTDHNYCTGNLTRYGKVRSACQDSGDMGGFYVGQTFDRVNYWNQLSVDLVGATASMTDFAPHAIMYDDHGANQDVRNVGTSNIQGTVAHNNSGGSVTEVNCSWNGGFSSALMDTANIGLRPWFPFA